MTSHIACDSKMYSALVVERAISLSIMDVQSIGQSANVIVNPVCECTLGASDELSLVREPAKSVSTKQLSIGVHDGLRMYPLSLMPLRYQAIRLMASSCFQVGTEQNRAH